MRSCGQLKRQPRTLEFYTVGPRPSGDQMRGPAGGPRSHPGRPWTTTALAPSRGNRLERALRRFFRWVAKEYGIPNPMLEVERTRLKKKLPRILTRTQIRAVWAACRDDRERALMGLLLDTGLRLGEVANLTRQDVGGLFHPGLRQGRGRWVPVSPWVRKAILANVEGDLCWVSQCRGRGRPLGRSGIQQAVRKSLALRQGSGGGSGQGPAGGVQHRPEPAPAKAGGSQFTSWESPRSCRIAA